MMQENAASPSPISGRFPSRRMIRWSLVGVLGIGGYFLLLWLLPMLVDKQATRTGIRRWIEAGTAYRSPTTLEGVEVALRAGGRGDLYLQQLRLDSPNPEFDRPCLHVETVRVSAFAPSVLLGMPTEPVVQIRSATLRLERDPFDEMNIADFLRPSTAAIPPLPFPLFRCPPDFLTLQLMRNRILWQDRNQRQEVSLPVDGTIDVDHAGRRLVGRLQPTTVSYSFRGTDRNESVTFGLSVQRFELEWGGEPEEGMPYRLRNLALDFQDMPIRAGTLFRFPIPSILKRTTLSGRFEYADNRFFFRGTAEGLVLPGLAIPRVVSVDLRPLSPEGEGEEGTVLVLEGAGGGEGEGGFYLRILLHVDPRDTRIRLHGEFPPLDLDAYRHAPEDARQWVTSLTRHLGGMTVEAEQLRIGGFNLEGAELLLARPAGGPEALSIQGTGAGGRLHLLAGGTDLADGRLPATCKVQYTITRLDAAWAAIARAWDIPASLPVRSGTGEAILELDRQGKCPHWRIRAALSGVGFSSMTDTALLRELSTLPQQMVAAENLRRRAQIPPLPTLVPGIDARPTLEYDTVLLDASWNRDGEGLSLQIMARGTDESEMLITGSPRNGIPLRMDVLLRAVPEAAFAHPGLSPDILESAHKVLEEKGLRILYTFTGSGWEIERPYIQDIFRIWNQHHLTATPANPSSPPPPDALPEPTP